MEDKQSSTAETSNVFLQVFRTSYRDGSRSEGTERNTLQKRIFIYTISTEQHSIPRTDNIVFSTIVFNYLCSTFSVGKNLSNCLVVLWKVAEQKNLFIHVFHVTFEEKFHYKLCFRGTCSCGWLIHTNLYTGFGRIRSVPVVGRAQ